METLQIPEFKSKDELFDFLVENKQSLIAQKKSVIKYADCEILVPPSLVDLKGDPLKANGPISTAGLGQLKVRVVINTTNWMDSHLDVHIPKLWKKSLKENKMIMHVQEHKSREFEKIISDGDDLKAYTKMMSWINLGHNFEGNTEALIFDSLIKQIRNEFMLKQYANGFVRNHSVGMRYVQIVMAINNKRYGAEYEMWEKYRPMIVNGWFADEKDFFWAVKEAQVVEGSAVPLGSNIITPTLNNNLKFEPSEDTQIIYTEPSKDTQKQAFADNLKEIKIELN